MPLTARYVEPQELHKTPLLQSKHPAHDELERMAVASLTAVIRQLSSLAKHAESIMGDIADILVAYHGRAQLLEQRVTKLKNEVLPSFSDEVFTDFKVLPSESHFRSDKRIDQQVLCIHNATPALQHQYASANPIPPLHLFTLLRDDGKNALKFYSDPNFFFETWRNNQLKENNTSKGVKQRKHNNDVQNDTGFERPNASLPNGTGRRSSTLQPKYITTGVSRHQTLSKADLSLFGVPRYRSNTFAHARSSMRKKSQHHPLANLSKVQAEVYIDAPVVSGKPPALAYQQEQIANPKEGFLKRSFSFRKPKLDKKQNSSKEKLFLTGDRSRDLWSVPPPAAKEASIYNGLSQQHLEALSASALDLSSTPAVLAIDGTVTFRAPKVPRERPVSLLAWRLDTQSPKSNRVKKGRYQFQSVSNSEQVGSAVELFPSTLSLCSSASLTSSVTKEHLKKTVLPPPSPAVPKAFSVEGSYSEGATFGIKSDIVENLPLPVGTLQPQSYVAEGGLHSTDAAKLKESVDGAEQGIAEEDIDVFKGSELAPTDMLPILDRVEDMVSRMLQELDGTSMTNYGSNQLYQHSSHTQPQNNGTFLFDGSVSQEHNEIHDPCAKPDKTGCNSDEHLHEQESKSNGHSKEQCSKHNNKTERIEGNCSSDVPLEVLISSQDPVNIHCHEKPKHIGIKHQLAVPLKSVVRSTTLPTPCIEHPIKAVVMVTEPLSYQCDHSHLLMNIKQSKVSSVPFMHKSSAYQPGSHSSSSPQSSDYPTGSHQTFFMPGGTQRTNDAHLQRNLLEDIKKGIQLRKVTHKNKKPATDTNTLPWDVAAILERRRALESKPEPGSDSESETADNEWEDSSYYQ